MRIFILGSGRMGSWLAWELACEHEVAVFDKDPARRGIIKTVNYLDSLTKLADFKPELCINAVSLQHSQAAFREVLDFLPNDCLLCDIMSVKGSISDFYAQQSRPFISVHPMFGPTFSDIAKLEKENAIIISESDSRGKAFFRGFFEKLKINIVEYSFQEHDEAIAYSLSTPFAATLVFAANMEKQQAPGSTFKKHLEIAKGLLSEDDYLLAEILFNPWSGPQLDNISRVLEKISSIIKEKDHQRMIDFLHSLRKNLGLDEIIKREYSTG